MTITRRRFLHRLPAGAAVPLAGAHAGLLEIVVPEDGGTPRDRSRIVRLGPSEFRIEAEVTEKRSPLTHALSRVDLILRNGGPAATAVLHLNLSGGGTRPNFDTSMFGGMPKRDFIYVQRPGEPWRRIDGTTEGWVANVRFEVPQGDTRIGLGPWYTYADYLGFVRSLPDHPHLRKEMIGRSDGDREHWELTITDPAVPSERKRRILWHAREHAYETFSSYAIEGAIGWLLSPEGLEARREYVFTLHPMTNVDGVAEGYEYRGGYDYPDPKGTATARLTYEATDRVRPHIMIAWHNWTAPRDIEVVFYTDSEDGKPSRRAWDLLTEHLPSPRAVGHRYDAETSPLRHNWAPRKPPGGNVHGYAMQAHGTHIWGWEMPWWGRDEGDPGHNARQHGAAFARAFTATQARIQAGWTPPAEAAPVRGERWAMHEWTLRGRAHAGNPFRDTALVGEFAAPSGKTIVAEGFYDGADVWRLRFAPDEEGEWRYLLRGEGAELFQHGRLVVTPAKSKGFIRIHPENPYAFAYSEGTAFFPMGDTCYGLFDDSPITPALRAEYLDTRRRQRFNFVRISIGHSPYRAEADTGYWAWGGSAKQPDLDRLNPAFFQRFDALMRDLEERGMNVELLLLNLYRRPFTDPALWTAPRQRLWLRYVAARYAAFQNVFLWTVANEYETWPDGKYRLDRPSDIEWAKATARLVRELDPYGHPVTVHPVISSSTKGSSPRDPFEPPWRIGGFFGESKEIDVLSQQTSVPYAGTWDEKFQAWTGDAAGVDASIAADRVYRKPVLNTESGYEYLRGYATNRQQVHHTDKVRRAAWRIVCAGGYLAAGFISTIGHSDNWDRIDPGSKHPFLVQSEGAAEQLALLHEFFTKLPFWRMAPCQGEIRGDGVCLAIPGELYVVYLPNGGSIEVNSGSLPARWFDPRTGKLAEAHRRDGSGRPAFAAPDNDDWVLLIG